MEVLVHSDYLGQSAKVAKKEVTLSLQHSSTTKKVRRGYEALGLPTKEAKEVNVCACRGGEVGGSVFASLPVACSVIL